jgi:hypothetical protein
MLLQRRLAGSAGLLLLDLVGRDDSAVPQAAPPAHGHADLWSSPMAWRQRSLPAVLGIGDPIPLLIGRVRTPTLILVVERHRLEMTRCLNCPLEARSRGKQTASLISLRPGEAEQELATRGGVRIRPQFMKHTRTLALPNRHAWFPSGSALCAGVPI